MTGLSHGSNRDGFTTMHKMDIFTEWNPSPIIELNLEGEIIYLNLAARGRFPTLKNVGLIHPILFRLKDRVRELMQIKGEFVVFYREVSYLSCDYEQQIFSVGGRDSIFIYMMDITSQKNTEKQLKQKNIELFEKTEFLMNILDSSIEYSIIASDLEGVILVWNAGAKHSYGYEIEEVVRKKYIRDLNAEEDLRSDRIQSFLDTVLKNGKADGTFIHVRKNNERFTASVAVSLRRNAEGKAIGYLIISRDLTEKINL